MTANMTPDLVACAWLSGLTCMSGYQVGTSLPQPQDWSSTVFAVCTTIVSNIDPYSGMIDAVVQIDLYGKRSSNSNRPPYAIVGSIGSFIEEACVSNTAKTVTATAGTYNKAHIRDASPELGFIKRDDKTSGLARFMGEVRIVYTNNK